MSLSNKEIDYIRKYLDKQGIHYWDIQAELIDHFATSIEEQRENDPGIPLKEALHSAHRKFGGEKGFRKFLLRTEHNVLKKTFLLLSRTIIGFFGWPWIALTLCIGASWYFILRICIAGDILNYIFFIGIASLIVFLINNIRLRKSPWYLPRQTNTTLGLIYYLLFYSGIPFLFQNYSTGNIWLTDAFLTLLTLCCISGILLPARLIRETENIFAR